jgi:hypothetical protein
MNYPKLVWSILPTDLVCPDGVDFLDYSFFAELWNTSADFDQSGLVDPNDLLILSQDWLKNY